jgi:hypothetical protein
MVACVAMVLGGMALAQTDAPQRSLVQAGQLMRTVRGNLLWSPRGDRIACTEELLVADGEPTGRVLCVTGIDDRSVVRVGDGEAPMDPAWSPDGEHLAYIAEDPTTPGHGDLVVSTLGDPVVTPPDDREPRHLTRGGGFFMPKWVQEPDADRFLIVRDQGRGITGTRSICLFSPGEQDPALAYRPLAKWENDESGMRNLVLSPSGRLAFYTTQVADAERSRKVLGLGLFRLGDESGWTRVPAEPEPLAAPPGATKVVMARWSPDETRIALVVKGAAELDWSIWVLDIATGQSHAAVAGGDPGMYLCIEWADRGTALLALYAPGAGEGRGPQLRVVPLDGGKPVTLTPDWGTGLVIDQGVELAADPTGTIFAVGAADDIRLLRLGTEEEASKWVSRRNLIALGNALLEWAQSNVWADTERGLLPDPNDERCRKAFKGIDWKADDFWVDLVRRRMEAAVGHAEFEARLLCPGDPRKGRSSYFIPESSYGLDVSFAARTPGDTVILREREGLHPDGYYVLRWNPVRVEWVPTIATGGGQ